MLNNQNFCAGKIVLWGVKTNYDVRPIRQATVQNLLDLLNCNAESVDYYTQIPVMQKLMFDGLSTPQIHTYSLDSAAKLLADVEQSAAPCIIIDYLQIVSYLINDPACQSLDNFILQLKKLLLQKQKTAIITAYVSSDFDGSRLPEWMLKLEAFADNIHTECKLLVFTEQ